MAKIAIKSEKITPFGGIFHVMDQFSSVLGPLNAPLMIAMFAISLLSNISIGDRREARTPTSYRAIAVCLISVTIGFIRFPLSTFLCRNLFQKPSRTR